MHLKHLRGREDYRVGSCGKNQETWSYTVDGSEILRSPDEVGSLSHYLQGFSTILGGAGVRPSTVEL